MELLEGEPLSEVLMRERRLDVQRALHIAAHVLRGLAHAHGQGVVHRDVKPENVFLVKKAEDPDFAKLLDFGLAKLIGDAQAGQENLTRAGFAIGTPTYMAPEWFTMEPGSEIDGRADLYSLSVALFEMIAGSPPFSSERKGEVLRMHVTKPVPRLREIAPSVDVPREVEELIRRGLAKEPGKRIASATDYLQAVEAVQKGKTPELPSERESRGTEIFHGAPKMDAVDEGWAGGGVSTPAPKVPNPGAPNRAPLPPPFRGTKAEEGMTGTGNQGHGKGPGQSDLPGQSQHSPASASPVSGPPPAAASSESGPPAPAYANPDPPTLAPFPRHGLIDRLRLGQVRSWSREKQFIAAAGAALALVLIIAFAVSGDDGKSAPRSGMPRDSDAPSGGISPSAILNAWEDAGMEPGGFADVDGAPLGGGRCRAGAVSGVSVTLCEYGNTEAPRTARTAALKRVGETTGAAIPVGTHLLIVADRNAVDPSGKRINEIIKTFQKAAGGK
jgi:serine/threonine protein kinase